MRIIHHSLFFSLRLVKFLTYSWLPTFHSILTIIFQQNVTAEHFDCSRSQWKRREKTRNKMHNKLILRFHIDCPSAEIYNEWITPKEGTGCVLFTSFVVSLRLLIDRSTGMKTDIFSVLPYLCLSQFKIGKKDNENVWRNILLMRFNVILIMFFMATVVSTLFFYGFCFYGGWSLRR